MQRIMRHADPKLTMDVYSHLAPEYLRAEVDRLAFGVRPAEVPVAPPLLMAVNTKTGPSGAPVVQGKRDAIQPQDSEENSLEIQTASPARQAGLEPTTLGLEGRCSIQLSYWRKAIFSATYIITSRPGSGLRSLKPMALRVRFGAMSVAASGARC